MFTEGLGAREALLSYEQALYELGARPHWGQLHEFTGTRGWAQAAYPKLNEWLEVFRYFNHKRVFDNQFTDRMRFRDDS